MYFSPYNIAWYPILKLSVIRIQVADQMFQLIYGYCL